MNGHICVLDWFSKSGYLFEYTEDAINFASSNGHVQVLEWFKNSGYEFIFTHKAKEFAYRNKHFEVIKWFENNNMIEQTAFDLAKKRVKKYYNSLYCLEIIEYSSPIS